MSNVDLSAHRAMQPLEGIVWDTPFLYTEAAQIVGNARGLLEGPDLLPGDIATPEHRAAGVDRLCMAQEAIIVFGGIARTLRREFGDETGTTMRQLITAADGLATHPAWSLTPAPAPRVDFGGYVARRALENSVIAYVHSRHTSS